MESHDRQQPEGTLQTRECMFQSVISVIEVYTKFMPLMNISEWIVQKQTINAKKKSESK